MEVWVSAVSLSILHFAYILESSASVILGSDATKIE